MRGASVVSVIVCCSVVSSCAEIAAQQALGAKALSVPLLAPEELKPGRIYREAKDGSIHEICSNDFKDQNALKSLAAKDLHSTEDVVADRGALDDAAVSFLGVSARFPYRHVKVSGFTLRAIDVDEPYEYILSNVGSNCRNDVLSPKKGHYFVTSKVAIAKKAEVLARGPVGSSVGIGGVLIDPGTSERVVSTRTNVVFGAVAERH